MSKPSPAKRARVESPKFEYTGARYLTVMYVNPDSEIHFTQFDKASIRDGDAFEKKLDYIHKTDFSVVQRKKHIPNAKWVIFDTMETLIRATTKGYRTDPLLATLNSFKGLSFSGDAECWPTMKHCEACDYIPKVATKLYPIYNLD